MCYTVLPATSLAVGHHCSDVHTYTVESSSSVDRDNIHLETRVRQINVLQLPPPNSIACFRVNETRGEMAIHVAHAEEICTKKLLGYVPALPAYEARSEFHCPWVFSSYGNHASCGKNEYNAKIFDAKYKNRLGRSGCDIDFPYTCNACFFYAPTSYWRMFVSNTRQKAYELSTCESWRFALDLEVTLKEARSKNKFVRITIDTSISRKVTIFNESVEITLSDVTDNDKVVPYKSACFARDVDTNETFYVPTCLQDPREATVYDGVGGLICDSATSAKAKFLPAANCSLLKRVLRSADLITCEETFNQNNLLAERKIASRVRRFPYTTSTHTITYRGDNDSSVVVRFNEQVTGHLMIVTKSLRTSQMSWCGLCELNETTLSFVGTYASSSEGALLSFVARSSVDDDVATVVCNPGHLERSVHLSTDFALRNVTLYPNVRATYTCMLVCCENVVRFSLRTHTTLRRAAIKLSHHVDDTVARADRVANSGDPDELKVGDTGFLSGAWLRSVGKWFTSLFDFSGWLSWIVASLMLLICLGCTARAVLNCRQRKLQSVGYLMREYSGGRRDVGEHTV